MLSRPFDPTAGLQSGEREMARFDGKRILVTGSGTGIGQAAARVFLDEGARVAINDITQDAVERSIAELGVDGLVAASGDLSSVAGAQAAVTRALDGLGGLDVLINNAGIAGANMTTWEYTDEEWGYKFSLKTIAFINPSDSSLEEHCSTNLVIRVQV